MTGAKKVNKELDDTKIKNMLKCKKKILLCIVCKEFS